MSEYAGLAAASASVTRVSVRSVEGVASSTIARAAASTRGTPLGDRASPHPIPALRRPSRLAQWRQVLSAAHRSWRRHIYPRVFSRPSWLASEGRIVLISPCTIRNVVRPREIADGAPSARFQWLCASISRDDLGPRIQLAGVLGKLDARSIPRIRSFPGERRSQHR